MGIKGKSADQSRGVAKGLEDEAWCYDQYMRHNSLKLII